MQFYIHMAGFSREDPPEGLLCGLLQVDLIAYMYSVLTFEALYILIIQVITATHEGTNAYDCF